MARSDCPICRGNGMIKLPLFHRAAVASYTAEYVPSVEETSRTYACPECSPKISEDNVVFMRSKVDVADLPDAGYQESARKEAAMCLVDGLLSRGLISFKTGHSEIYNCTAILATVGVVSTKTVTSLDERIAERQMEMAERLVGRAIEEISVWGSYYTGSEGTISKGLACDSVKRAFDKMVAQIKKEG